MVYSNLRPTGLIDDVETLSKKIENSEYKSETDDPVNDIRYANLEVQQGYADCIKEILERKGRERF